MTPIRTPATDPDKPVPFFYSPFREGWRYEGQTYGRRIEDGVTKPGHSPYSVDFNRRTPNGGWVQDLGDPVLAAADGEVGEVDRAEGLVMLDHADGYRTEYRHMQDILVRKGQWVDRGDRIGSIGDVAGSGRSTAPHLHHVHWRNGKRIPMRIEGKPIATSVGDSDTKPATWDPPAPVAVVGPPPRATWKGAYEERTAQAEKLERQRDDARAQTKLATEERDTARAEVALLTTTVAELRSALTTTEAALVECRNATVPDCSEVIAELSVERDRAVAAEELVRRVRELVTL